MRKTSTGVAGIAIIAALAGPASAAHIDFYTAMLQPLNGSGVSGKANLALDTDAQTLLVQVIASGLEPNQLHVQHIHGRFSDGVTGSPIDSNTPTAAQDTDGDGFIELLEGLPSYGPIIVPLSSPPGGATENFPMAADGTINFSQLYDLNDADTFATIPNSMEKYTKDDLLPLDLREIVLHGLTVPEGVGAGTDGEVDGSGGYKVVLPIAAGEFQVADANYNVVPLPAAGWMLLSALGGLGLLGRRRARRTAEA